MSSHLLSSESSTASSSLEQLVRNLSDSELSGGPNSQSLNDPSIFGPIPNPSSRATAQGITTLRYPEDMRSIAPPHALSATPYFEQPHTVKSGERSTFATIESREQEISKSLTRYVKVWVGFEADFNHTYSRAEIHCAIKYIPIDDDDSMDDAPASLSKYNERVKVADIAVLPMESVGCFKEECADILLILSDAFLHGDIKCPAMIRVVNHLGIEEPVERNKAFRDVVQSFNVKAQKKVQRLRDLRQDKLKEGDTSRLFLSTEVITPSRE